jgi:hypothetical protein
MRAFAFSAPSPHGGCSLISFVAKGGNMRGSGHGRQEEAGAGEVVAATVGDEVAHVRARFAVDPSTPSRLADAWTAPTGPIEEDESEFLDAVADCVSVGLPVDAAVASWRSGTLEVAGSEKDDEEDEDDADTDVYDPHKPGAGRRLIVR